MLWIGDFCLQIKFLIISSLVDRIDRNASFLSFWPWFIRFITNFLANLYVRRYFWCIEQSWRSKTLDRNNITSCSSSAMAVADCFRAVWLERTSQNRKAHSYDPHEHSPSLLFLGGHGLICTLALCLFLWNHGHFFIWISNSLSHLYSYFIWNLTAACQLFWNISKCWRKRAFNLKTNCIVVISNIWINLKKELFMPRLRKRLVRGSVKLFDWPCETCIPFQGSLYSVL